MSALLQSPSIANISAPGTNVFYNLAVSATAGSTSGIVILVWKSSVSALIATNPIQDNKAGGSSTYTQIGSTLVFGATGHYSAAAFFCQNLAAGVTQVSAVFAVGNVPAILIFLEDPDPALTGAFLDLTALITEATFSATPFSSGAMAASTAPNTVLYGVFGVDSSSAAGFAGTGTFGTATTTGDVPFVGDGDDVFWMRREVTSQGAYAATGTTTAANTGFALVFAVRMPQTVVAYAPGAAVSAATAARAAAPPIQPARFFTPGQPLGIPKPRLPDHLIAESVYFRTAQYEHAPAAYSRSNFVAGFPAGNVRSLPLQGPAQIRGEDRAALVYETEAFVVPATIAANVAASSLQPPAWSRQDLTAVLEEAAPYFTPGLPLGVPLPQPLQHLVAGATYFRAPVVEPAILDEVLPFWTPGQPLGQPGAPTLQIPLASLRSELTALELVLPPYLVPIAPSAYVPFVAPWNAAAYALRDRASEIAAIDESLPLFTPGQPLGRPGAPILQIPIASVRSELAALEEVLPPFFVPIAPSSYLPFSPAANMAAYALRDRASEIAAIDESLPFFTPGQPLGQPGAPTLQIPVSQRAELAPLDEVLPPFFVPQPPAAFVSSISLQIPAAAIRFELPALDEVLPPFNLPAASFTFAGALQLPIAIARSELAALEEVLPPFGVVLTYRPPAPTIAISLYVRREDPAPLMQPARRSLPPPPTFLDIDPNTLIEASYQSRLLLAPYAPPIVRSAYVGRRAAPYDPGSMIVSYDGRKLT